MIFSIKSDVFSFNCKIYAVSRMTRGNGAPLTPNNLPTKKRREKDREYTIKGDLRLKEKKLKDDE